MKMQVVVKSSNACVMSTSFMKPLSYFQRQLVGKTNLEMFFMLVAHKGISAHSFHLEVVQLSDREIQYTRIILLILTKSSILKWKMTQLIECRVSNE